MKRFYVRLLVMLSAGVIVLSTMASQVSANPKVTQQVVFYDITGRTAKDLLTQMRSVGPADRGDGNQHFFAHTDWHVHWHYTYRRAGQTCAMASVSVDLDVQYIYPRWKNQNEGDAATRAKWAALMTGVQIHEPGHAQHGLDAARDIERTLASLPSQPTCDALGALANAWGDGIIRKYDQIDVEYDRATDHGRTQGAYLPY